MDQPVICEPPQTLLWSLTLRQRMMASEKYMAAVGLDLGASAVVQEMRKAAPSLSASECACALLAGARTVNAVAKILLDELARAQLGERPVPAGVAHNLPDSLRLAWARAQKPTQGTAAAKNGERPLPMSAHAEPRELHPCAGSIMSPSEGAEAVARAVSDAMGKIAADLFGAEALLFAVLAGSREECYERAQAGAERNALSLAAQTSASALSAQAEARARKPKSL